ncbi:MAG: hypothetical protein J6V19_08330, partial [Alistipes sp.]|nr:hypothetical protein [Alistipes sp.]
MKRLFLLFAAVTLSFTAAFAEQEGSTAATPASVSVATKKMETTDRFLPTTRRVDRNIDLNKFVYKGEWMLGIAAS